MGAIVVLARDGPEFGTIERLCPLLPAHANWPLVPVNIALVATLLIASGNLTAACAQAHTIGCVGFAPACGRAHRQLGVPHIYASHTDDLYFAQGYVAAQQRLFQIDLWRRRGWGAWPRLSVPISWSKTRLRGCSCFGVTCKPSGAATEKAHSACRALYGGCINAFIDQTPCRPQPPTLEFKLLGYRPEHWDASDVVRIRSHGLYPQPGLRGGARPHRLQGQPGRGRPAPAPLAPVADAVA